MYGGTTSPNRAVQRVVALCGVALGLEVLAAFLQPFAHWIPQAQLAVATSYAVAIYFIARHRIPKAARHEQSPFKVTGSCLSANHHGCGQHCECPCYCHDNHIKRMMVWPASSIDAGPIHSGA